MISFLKNKLKAKKGSVDPLHGGDGSLPAVAAAVEAEMGFLDHLEELRWTLFKGFGAVIGCTVIAAFFKGWVIQNILLGPKKPDFISYRIFGIETTEFALQNRTVT